jgi:hypothetical protein
MKLIFHSLMNCVLQMSGRIREAARGLQPRLTIPLLIFLSGIISLTADGQLSSAANSITTASQSLLPRNAIVPIEVVTRLFPEMTQEANTGRNLTAVGKPKATRLVVYANSDSSKKVTMSVDEHTSSNDALAAYEEAFQKSKIVPGFKSLPAPNLGEHAFIGTVTQGAETHIGLGALDGTLIIGATLVGYDPTAATTAKLISLLRDQEAVARKVLNRHAHN